MVYKRRTGRRLRGAGYMKRAVTGLGGMTSRFGRLGINTGVRMANAAVTIRNAATKIRNLNKMKRDLSLIQRTSNKRDVMGGDYSQFTRKTYTLGKKKTFNSLIPKLFKSNLNRMVYQFRGIKNFDDYGYYQSYQYLAGTLLHFPFYVLDLTARTTNNGTVVPLVRMVTDITGANDGKIRWVSESSLNNAGSMQTGAGYSVVENGNLVSGVAGVDPVPPAATDKEFLNWTNLKMVLYGAKNKAVEWTVSIVKLLDEDLDPWKANGTTNNLHQVFWQSKVKGLTWNPQADIINPHRKKMKILKQYKWIIQPTSSTENDVDPHQKIVTIFNRWNRLIDYRQNGVSAINDTQLTLGLDVPQGYVAGVQTESTSKILVLIHNTAYTPMHEVFDNATDASFDLVVRKQISTVQQPKA